MRSDTGSVRLVKLWISLWNMVLEGKRHLETVTAVLQHLVFEKQGFPRFKNWPEICKLGETDKMLMWAVATVDTESDNEHVHQLMAAFPQCFSDAEVSAPIPWSVLVDYAVRSASHDGSPAENARKMLVLWDAASHFKVPFQEFIAPDFFGEKYLQDSIKRGSILEWPSEIPDDVEVGSKVCWRGKEWVVIENRNGFGDDNLCIAPADLIRLDL